MKSLLLLLLVGACSSYQGRPQLSDTAKDAPAWLFSPYDGCDERAEMCASGEGKTYAQADAEARQNLASIFEVKVTSEMMVTTSASQQFPWQGQVKEDVQRSLQESVNQLLETVEIKKHHRQDRLSYSLAALSREKGGNLLSNRMKKVDDELETLWRNQQRTNLRRIVRLYLEREKLNERFSIVTGHDRPSPLSWQKIVQWRESRPAQEPLLLKIGQAPDWLKDKVSEVLTESGFRLVKGEASKVVTLNVDSIREFLNVEGFEKYTFTLTLASVDQGEKKKTISTSETVTGRSQGDALLKVKHAFTDYIDQHISDLHLD